MKFFHTSATTLQDIKVKIEENQKYGSTFLELKYRSDGWVAHFVTFKESEEVKWTRIVLDS